MSILLLQLGHCLTNIIAAQGSVHQHYSSDSGKSIRCQSNPTNQQDFVALKGNLGSTFCAKSS